MNKDIEAIEIALDSMYCPNGSIADKKCDARAALERLKARDPSTYKDAPPDVRAKMICVEKSHYDRMESELTRLKGQLAAKDAKETCEWHREDIEEMEYWFSSCGYGTHIRGGALAFFNVCPHCGKPIKVKEQ